MWHAVSFALLDSVNLLLIGVLVAIGIFLPRSGKYRSIASLLVIGDWLGVFLLSLATMFIFNGLQDVVQSLISSPIFGIVLIAVGVLGVFFTWRGGDSSALVEKMLPPLKTPTWKTFATGFILGVVQSVTSVPFFSGIAYLSVGDYSTLVKYVGMFFYACLALSLPALSAILVGVVRRDPHSAAGRLFTWTREHSDQATNLAGYLVAVVLILMGVLHL
ncbi:hypothetical protein ACXM2N_03990 [Corynebacterium sp. ZY180755]